MAHPQPPRPDARSEKAPIRQAYLPLSRRIRGALGQLRETLVAIDREIPLEDITAQRTADVISRFISHPSNERRGLRPEELPFDITDILVEMGYDATLFRTGNFMKKHPEAYGIARRRLLEVSQMGGVQMEELPEPSSHGEIIAYRVADLETLRKIASGEIKPQSDIASPDTTSVASKP
ncbi:MAG: hypothetical protein M1405_01380 [Patescibacteria group bacterium]|nr:hypothetical protein [Patescibacteria group bacterium]